MTKRITEETEERMVARLFKYHGTTIYEHIGLSCQTICKLSVVGPIITNRNSKPGDIDVLLTERNTPQKAVAIECKRIKITATSPQHDAKNKLSGIVAGRMQAEALCKMGFYRTYLALVIQADVAERSGSSSLFKFPLPGTVAKVRDAVRCCNLCPHVGIIYIENTQPTDESFENLGGLCVDIIREAIPHPQKDELTVLVSEALKTGERWHKTTQ